MVELLAIVVVVGCSHQSYSTLNSVTRPTAITPTTSSAAESTISAAVSACVASQLAGRGGRQGENGGAHGDIELGDTGAEPCMLTGFPTVALTSGGTILPVELRPPTATSPESVMLAAHGANQVDLAVFWSNWCKPNPGPIQIVVTFQNDGATLTGALRRAT